MDALFFKQKTVRSNKLMIALWLVVFILPLGLSASTTQVQGGTKRMLREYQTNLRDGAFFEIHVNVRHRSSSRGEDQKSI